MKGKLPIGLSVVAALLMVAGPTFAHHADLLYDRDHPITLSGTVTQFVFTNPHVQIGIDVKGEDGAVTHWTAVAGPPYKMFKDGWTRDSLAPGDAVTVTGGPYSKDGKHEIFVLKMPVRNK